MTKNGLWDEETTKYKESHKADEEDIMVVMVENILTQYSFKQGLAKYGKRAEEATEKALTQIHNMSVLKPLDANKLTKEEKKKVIASLIFPMEKSWDIKIKTMCRW